MGSYEKRCKSFSRWTVKCKWCGKEFVKNGCKKYCSVECRRLGYADVDSKRARIRWLKKKEAGK